MKIYNYLLFLFILIFSNLEAQYVYGGKSTSESISAIQPPMMDEAPKFSTYLVEGAKAETIEHHSGTKIIIPPNAFVDENGEVVKGEVAVQFREFNNPLDIYLSGIPMTVDAAGQKEFFQSAGMVEIRANQNGTPVFPNPLGEMINVELTSSQLEDDFQTYVLDESTGEWVEEGTDSVLWNSKDILTEPIRREIQNAINDPNPIAFFNPPVAPTIRKSNIHVRKLTKKTSPRKTDIYKSSLQFQIEVLQKEDSKSYKDSSRLMKYFPELYENRKMIWIYDGDNKKAASQFLTNLQKSPYRWRNATDSLKKYKLEDITIKSNKSKDNYTITFHCEGVTKELAAFPYLHTQNPRTEQKRNQKFYKKYLQKHKARCEKWATLDTIYNKLFATYEIEFEKYQKMLLEKNVIGMLSPDQIASGVTRRRMPIVTFGVLNIDKVMKKLDARMLANFETEAGEKLDYLKVVIFDQTNNAVLTFYPDEKIRFDRSSKNHLLLVLENE
ncbi:MAG: hypothetical protein AAF573_19475, partial [Bacteroidota bacterium]